MVLASARLRVRRGAGRLIRRLGLLPAGQPDGLGEDAALVGSRFAETVLVVYPDAPTNLYQLAKKEATIRGMLVTSSLDRVPEWAGRAAGWLADGTLHTEETVVEGLDRAPQALIDVLRGANLGKMLVRLDRPNAHAFSRDGLGPEV